MEKKWMVIYTKPRSEKKVEQRLLANGIVAYCPTYKTLKQWSDRKKKVELPLLPSYVFVKVNELERAIVLQDPGAMNFIFWQGKPAIVKDREIEILQKEMPSFVIPEAQIGDFITIDHGAFKGQKGKLQSIGKDHVVIFLESLGVTVKIKTKLT
jgi:transcriptional antiterminator RfaH